MAGFEVITYGRFWVIAEGHGSEEQTIDHLLVLIRDAADGFRYGKDDMEVLAVEKLGLAIFDPLRAG